MPTPTRVIPPLPEISEDPLASQAIYRLLPDVHKIETSSGATVVARTRSLDNAELPVLVMIHGYPQSMNMFRYIVERLPEQIPLFIPDIPGYGESTHSATPSNTAAYSKRAIGNIILEALKKLLNTPERKIILLGHDRGARIIHRLAVDAAEGFLQEKYGFDLVGVALLDIIPTIVQFASFTDPAVAAATFHWSFLAAPSPLPENMIGALGGDVFVDNMIRKWTGVSGEPQVSLGIPIYAAYFKRPSVIAASCADYRAGALVDAPEQVADQKGGRKINCPTYVLYSEGYLGSRYEVEKVWNDWVHGSKGLLSTKGVGNGVGHFLCEEAPEEVTNGLLGWIRKYLGVKV
ncbi:uncharacterized protein LAJ45_00866 [Morchella importuna]|uniref:uncharacterized protein n=1 Tax=Morchella importuna TaxID=1174673 RepID=UPI001E8E904A|nr:uncharacterized protein LAJ45_00866 [Morchella importuna]KAH8155854.1 hypothetical protein LAJ45_00866 [Morchella importuna]